MCDFGGFDVGSFVPGQKNPGMGGWTEQTNGSGGYSAGENQSIISGILGELGEYTSQKDVSKQYKKQIGQILQNTQMDIQQTRTSQGRRLDMQRANYGKAGVKMTGSAVDLINEQIRQDELDLLNKRYEGQIKIGDAAQGMKQASQKAETALGKGVVRAFDLYEGNKVNKGFGLGSL